MERLTIKQLAEQLGVSKTAVRKHLTDDFRENYVETTANGTITISSEGCKLIAETMERSANLSKTTANEFAETTENTANITIPLVVWNALQAQLEEKDRQLAAKDEQIRNLTETTKSQAQSINAERHAELIEAAQLQLEAPKEKKSFFGFLRRNKE